MSAILKIGIKKNRSVALKNNNLGTVDIIFIHKLQFPFFFVFFFFFFFSFIKSSAWIDSMVPCYSSNMNVIWLSWFLLPLPLQWGWEGSALIWKFAKILLWQNFFLHLWQQKPLWVELKTNGRVIFVIILLHFHTFISLDTANTQKSEVFLLRIFLGNVNASVVTCRYPQIYNFSFKK